MPFCRKCKQSEHKRKEYPRRESILYQLTDHGESNHLNSIEDVPQEAPSTSVFTTENENQPSFVDTTQTMSVENNESTIVNSIASTLQHRILYQAYKNPNNDLKRTCVDRSIDSYLDIDPKKSHTLDSFTSMVGDENENE